MHWKNPEAISLFSQMNLCFLLILSLFFSAAWAKSETGVFLALAGPYPKSPASAFGHLFLAIAPQDSLSFLNWAAVNFGAHTEDVSGISYYIKGINGSFSAYYSVLPVHEKIREYAGTETRDIKLFPLRISDEEKSKLIDTLKSWIEKPQPYKFFTYNCTHGIYTLLASSLDSLPPVPQKTLSPQELVLLLQKENRLDYPYLFPSLKERVISSKDKNIAELEFLEWENMRRGAERDSLREKKLAELRHSVSKSKKEKRDLLQPENQPLKPHDFFRLDIGTQFIEREPYAYIRFRPLLHDITDNPNYYSAQSSLELLAFGLIANKESVHLRELSIIHIRSASTHDSRFRAWTWDFFAGYKNDYASLNIGFGKSFFINELRKIAMEILLVNSARLYDNFVGVEMQLNKRLAVNFRYGAGFEYFRSVIDLKEEKQFRTWLSYNVNRNFNLYAENIFDIKEQKQLGLYARFYL
jgi:hypothetical protein